MTFYGNQSGHSLQFRREMESVYNSYGTITSIFGTFLNFGEIPPSALLSVNEKHMEVLTLNAAVSIGSPTNLPST